VEEIRHSYKHWRIQGSTLGGGHILSLPSPLPSLPIPSFPVLSLLSPLPLPPLSSLSLPSLLLRSRTPSIAAWGLGDRLSSPSGSAKRILVHLGLNLHLFSVLMTKNFLCLCLFSIKRMWELLGNLRSSWAFYFSEVVPSWCQSIEMFTTHVAVIIGWFV